MARLIGRRERAAGDLQPRAGTVRRREAVTPDPAGNRAQRRAAARRGQQARAEEDDRG